MLRWVALVFSIHTLTYMYWFNCALKYRNSWTVYYYRESSMCWDELRACLVLTPWHTCIGSTVHWNIEIAELSTITVRVLCVEMSGARVKYSQHDIHVQLFNCALKYKKCLTTWYYSERSVCWDELRACLVFTPWHTCIVSTVHWNIEIAQLCTITVRILCVKMSCARV